MPEQAFPTSQTAHRICLNRTTLVWYLIQTCFVSPLHYMSGRILNCDPFRLAENAVNCLTSELGFDAAHRARKQSETLTE
jgi:hypothetical protein